MHAQGKNLSVYACDIVHLDYKCQTEKDVTMIRVSRILGKGVLKA